MPKELTHWWLADEAMKRLPHDLPIRLLLEKELDTYLVGAVLPDTLLHLIRGQWSIPALQLARRFHEPAVNSFTPLVTFAEKTHLTPAITACLLGVAAHMEADIIFHPYICALAGEDLGEHYRIETELDLWLLHEGKRPPAWRLEELFADETNELAVMVLQGIFDQQDTLPREAFTLALKLHGRIQGMYGSPFWQLLARLLSLLPIPALRNYQKLFYPLYWRKGRNRSCPEQWCHGTTGEIHRDTLKGLADQAVTRITQFLQRVNDCGLMHALKNHPGENLLTGLATPPCRTPIATCATAPP